MTLAAELARIDAAEAKLWADYEAWAHGLFTNLVTAAMHDAAMSDIQALTPQHPSGLVGDQTSNTKGA